MFFAQWEWRHILCDTAVAFRSVLSLFHVNFLPENAVEKFCNCVILHPLPVSVQYIAKANSIYQAQYSIRILKFLLPGRSLNLFVFKSKLLLEFLPNVNQNVYALRLFLA